MENKKNSDTAIKILIVILSLLLIGSGGYITYRSFFERNTIDNTSDDNSNKELFTITPRGKAKKLYFTYNKTTIEYFSSDKKDYYSGEEVGTYNCNNKDCNALEIIKNFALIKDNYYYVYNYSSNKATKVDLGNGEFEKLSMLALNDDFYGIVTNRKVDHKSAFYSLEDHKYTINYNYRNIYGKQYGYEKDFSVALTRGYIFADNNEYINDKNNFYILDIHTGKVIHTFENTNGIYAFGNEQNIYYITYEDIESGGGKFYNSKFEPLFNGKSYYLYHSTNTGNLILGDGKTFSEYDSSGKLVKTSREFKSIELIVEDYIAVIDTDNYLKIVNYNGGTVAKFIEMTDNLSFISILSGYYEPVDKPMGVYLVVEDKTTPYEEGIKKGNEYYYDVKTGQTGVIANVEIGGYAKPVLYLYPKVKTNISVTFEKPQLLTTTYPKFNNIWKVIANPNGDLYDHNGNYYYALYWEESGSTKVDFSTGFYVTKDNAIKFLENKLSIIGLDAKERNEFIMYWLPIIEKNEKSLVYFELTEERDSYNKLIITPTPDSLLRLAIHVKKVNEKVNIKEQKLKTFKRSGFAAIEWGGVIH